MVIFHITLKHVIRRFRICNCFRKISKFCEFTNALMIFPKYKFLSNCFRFVGTSLRTIYCDPLRLNFANKLPQQIMYRGKGNLSVSPNHSEYRENILISRFYEQFSRSSRNLGHFWKFEKISNSWNINMSLYHFEAGDLEIPHI